MSEHGHTAPPAPPGGIDTVAAALKAPVKRARGRKKSDAEPRADATASGILPAIPEPAAPVAKPKLPTRLPEDAPVKALGTFQGDYSFLDSLGQVRTLPAKSISRNEIIALFGGDEYLKGKWPIYEQDKEGLWRPRDKFNHDVMSPVLISSCTDKGVWNRNECVRGPGSWREDDGALIMHCGQRLFIQNGEGLSVKPAGLHGDLLYSRYPAGPEPLTGANTGAGEKLFEQLLSWNWVRGETDARLALGWIVSAMIGQAAPWRPMMWATGGHGTGKSTLFKLFVWTLGKRGALKPTDTSPAFVYQSLGDSSLPVLLDEFESKDDNRRADAVINLMRIAASGGEVGRGGTENNPRTYNLKSSFAAFSIIVPPLTPQDLSRMAVLRLNPLVEGECSEPSDEETDWWVDDDIGDVQPTEQDTALGYRETWDTVGRQLRGRILTGWSRYTRTYNTYFKALKSVGHDPRGASQFGALGAAYDLAMYDDLSRDNVNAWVKMVPPSALDETRGYDDEPEACLQHLLGATIDLIRGGAKETVSYHLREAYRVKTSVETLNDPESSERALAKIGIKLVADKQRRWIDPVTGRESTWWIVEISNTHQALMAIFDGTHWKGKAGAKGGWAQALGGLDYAEKRAKQSRIDGAVHWVTQLALAGIFPTLYTNGGKDE